MQVWHSRDSNTYNVIGEFKCLKNMVLHMLYNDCKYDVAYQTFVESIPALKFGILEGSSQTCIKIKVQVIIYAPEQENVLC